MKIFGGVKSIYFAEEICKTLGIGIGKSTRKDFSDGEFISKLDETVRGENVYIVQSTCQPTNNLMELIQLADASKRAGAKSIIAVIPYFGFARQDRKSESRTPITAALIAKIIEVSGVNQVVTMDLHADQLQAFFNIPVSHIFSSASLVPFIRERVDGDFIIAAPDTGATQRAKAYSNFLKTDMIVCYKNRAEANKIKEMMVIGNVEGKHVLIVDDMADTCGTLSKCAEVLLEKGALSVKAVATHPVLSGKAYENIGNSKIQELIVTNSIPLKDFNSFEAMQNIAIGKGFSGNISEIEGYNKITVVDVAPLFANVINNIENHTSISANFL